MTENIVIKNADIRTMDTPGSADWIALEEGRIAALGKGEGYRAYCGEEGGKSYRIVDAGGNTVLPGFIDNHFHCCLTAIGADWISLKAARSFSDIGRCIGKIAKKKKGGLLIAYRLEDQQLKEKRFPDRTVLDRFCKDRPLVIYSADAHVMMLNTYAILFFKVPFSLQGVELDHRGMPTGIFRNQCAIKLDTIIAGGYGEEALERGMQDILQQMLSNGLTTVAAMEGGNMGEGFNKVGESEFIYHHGAQYPVDMDLFSQTMDISYVNARGLPRIGGALYVDGTIGARTAALQADYADAPGKRGALCIAQDRLQEFVAECYRQNIQVSLDAIGDEAIEVSLCAFAYAQNLYPSKDLRCRIEHGVMVTRSQMKRAAKLGVILSMQPAYSGLWQQPGGVYEQRLGERYLELNPFRQLLDEGVCICGGSDSYATDMDPMVGIHWAVNHPVQAHRISLEEALRMYTINGAYALFREKEIGSLTAGKRADVVILDRCLRNMAAEDLQKVKVAMTIKTGKILFQR